MSKQKIEFSKLQTAVAEATLANARLNDLSEGTEVSIKDMFTETPAGATEPVISIMLNAGSKVMSVTLYAFASMRIADANDATIKNLKTTEDVRGSAKIATLQDKMGDSSQNINQDTKYKVVHRVSIPNRMAKEAGAVVHQNNCYEGYQAFVNTTAEVWGDKGTDIAEKQRLAGIARNTLLGTPIRSGMNTPENEVKVPIFEVMA